MHTTRRELLLVAATLGLAGTGARAETNPWKETLSFLEAQQAVGVFPGAALVATQHGNRTVARCQGTYCSLARPDALLDAHVLHPLYSFPS